MSEPDKSGGTSGAPAGQDPPAASGAAGGAPEGFVPKAELDRIEAQRRETQADRDRATARIAALEAELAGKNGNGTSTSTAAAPAAPAAPQLDEAAIARIAAQAVDTTLNHREQMTAARDQLSQEFPSASKDVLSARYATPEEMGAAARQSHESAVAAEKAMREKVEAEVRAEAKRVYGIDIVAPQIPPAAGNGGEKKLTAADIATMSVSALQKLSKEDRQAALNGG